MSPRPKPSEAFEATLPTPERNPLAFTVSVFAHTILILGILLASKKLNEAAMEREKTTPTEPDRSVQMVYVPPPPRPQPQPQPVPTPTAPTPSPPVPIPPREIRPPEPEPNAPTEAVRNTGPEVPLPRAEQPRGETEGKAPENTDAPVDAATALNASMEAEAARIFGRRRGKNATEEGGPVATRPFANAKIPDNKCPEIPRDSTGKPVEGEVRGKVVDQDTGRPLSNAHLQMIGHQYNTFAGQDGSFILKFDLMLMADCRTQWVNIMAPGHRPQVLPIVMGGGISTVPLKRR